MRRRKYLCAVAAGVASAIAGCGDDTAADKTDPPDGGERVAWVHGHDYTFPLATVPGTDSRRRGINWGRRRLGRTTEAGDRSVCYVGGELYERQNPSAEFTHAVTALSVADGAKQWRSEFDGDRFDSGLEAVVSAGRGAVLGFDQERSISGGGLGGDTPGKVPEFARFNADGELTYTITAGDLAREAGASFAVAGSTVLISNGNATAPSRGQAVAGYDMMTGERRFLSRPAVVAATTESAALLVRPAADDTGDDTLVARDGSDGTVRWEQSVGYIYDLTVGPEQVYVVTTSGEGEQLHAFDSATGTNRWTANLNGDVRIGPVVLNDAVLVAGNTVSVYGHDGTDLGPVSEDAISPNVYDRIRSNDNHVFLVSRSDLTRQQTVALDRQTWEVVWVTDTALPILGAANDSYYIPSERRQIGDQDEGRFDTRIRLVAGEDRTSYDEFWVHGSLQSLDGNRLYTLLQTSDTALGGLYAYDLPIK